MPEHSISAAGTNVEGAHRSSYAGRRIALLTQHGKERVVAPVLQRALGCNVELVSGYDTDRLGTFTRDIPREGTQIEAARRKARIGMELSGLPLGLASEGSFGADPVSGLLAWNVELLVWIDAERDIEVVGLAQGNAAFAHLLAREWSDIAAFAKQVEFPSHQLVVRADGADGGALYKGIGSWEELEAAFHGALQQSAQGLVFVETDGRAHANPTRMRMIGRAAEDLARKLGSLCPVCATPGFATVEHVRGLRCADCDAPTREMRAEVFGCAKCAHRVTYERTDRPFADPGHCDYCNP
jgi:hypothetical protein